MLSLYSMMGYHCSSKILHFKPSIWFSPLFLDKLLFLLWVLIFHFFFFHHLFFLTLYCVKGVAFSTKLIWGSEQVTKVHRNRLILLSSGILCFRSHFSKKRASGIFVNWHDFLGLITQVIAVLHFIQLNNKNESIGTWKYVSDGIYWLCLHVICSWYFNFSRQIMTVPATD